MRGLARVLVALVLALAAVSCSTSTDGGIDPGLGSKDASGDVKLGNCKVDFGIVTCQLTIVNSSDGTSDYFIDAKIEDSSGANVGTANGFAMGIEGGQTAKTDLTGVASGNPKDVTVTITGVQRTAS